MQCTIKTKSGSQQNNEFQLSVENRRSVMVFSKTFAIRVYAKVGPFSETFHNYIKFEVPDDQGCYVLNMWFKHKKSS